MATAKNGERLKFGAAAGKASTSASGSEIRDRIKGRKPTEAYSFPFYVCVDWVWEAAADCGVSCN